MAHKVNFNNLFILIHLILAAFRFNFHFSQVIEKLCLTVFNSLPLLGYVKFSEANEDISDNVKNSFTLFKSCQEFF